MSSESRGDQDLPKEDLPPCDSRPRSAKALYPISEIDERRNERKGGKKGEEGGTTRGGCDGGATVQRRCTSLIHVRCYERYLRTSLENAEKERRGEGRKEGREERLVRRRGRTDGKFSPPSPQRKDEREKE